MAENGAGDGIESHIHPENAEDMYIDFATGSVVQNYALNLNFIIQKSIIFILSIYLMEIWKKWIKFLKN